MKTRRSEEPSDTTRTQKDIRKRKRPVTVSILVDGAEEEEEEDFYSSMPPGGMERE